jgi:hypothetical protein
MMLFNLASSTHILQRLNNPLLVESACSLKRKTGPNVEKPKRASGSFAQSLRLPLATGKGLLSIT